MKPKKEIIEKAKAEGVIDRINTLLSAAHILICESENLVKETDDLLREYQMKMGSLKDAHSKYARAFDRYSDEFQDMITGAKKTMDLITDLSDFDKSFRKWAKISEDWKPKIEVNESNN